MLIYSTILAVKDTLNHEAFIKLAIEWMQGSPHKDSIIPGVVWNGERNIRYGNNALWMEIVEYRNQNTIAIRYEKAEKDGIIWDTDFILNFTEKKLAVRLDRSYMPFFQSFDSTYSIPYFISLLMEKEYLELDGKLPVIREPIVIDKNNLSLLADIIFYRVPFNLPIVYISKTTYDEDPIPAGKLANRLRGIAHVLVQEANWTNPEIRNLCNSKNEYYGAVGIYYPLAPTNHIRYLYNDVYYGNNILFDKIINNIFTYSNSKSIPILYTWNGVNNSLLTDRLISKIKEKQAAERAQQQALNEK